MKLRLDGSPDKRSGMRDDISKRMKMRNVDKENKRAYAIQLADTIVENHRKALALAIELKIALEHLPLEQFDNDKLAKLQQLAQASQKDL